MIKTIYQFGEQLQYLERTSEYFEIFNAPYLPNKENQIVIYAKINNREYQGLSSDAYKQALKSKYLFRKLASANSTSIVPTLHFYLPPKKSDIKSSIEKFIFKLKRCIEGNEKIYAPFFDKKSLIQGLETEFESMIQMVCSESQNYLFTLQIDGQWLGDIPAIREILEYEAYNKYFSSGGKDFRAANKVCAVTYKPVKEVWGRVDTLGFTVNDVAFSRNGFQASDSYKMFPVSVEAVKILEGTRNVLDTLLASNFLNLKFFVLPRFIAVDDLELRKIIVDTFVIKKGLDRVSDFAEAQSRAIVQAENVFQDIIEDENLHLNSLYYDIFFYEQKQAQFSIKLHVSDILPSRFQEIIHAKQKTEVNYQPLTRVYTKKGHFDYYLVFTEIKKFFAEPFFFSIIEAVFHKTRINEELVLASFMQIITQAFKNQKEEAFRFPQAVKRSFCIYQYFQALQLFEKMEKNTMENPPLSKADAFVESHAFFNTDLKKGAFYLGCAVEVLLSSQRSYLKSEPFVSKLHNLNVTVKELMDIYPKLLNKAKEYSSSNNLYSALYFEDLLKLVGKFLYEDEQTNRTEVSYAFALGLVMEKEFTSNRIKDSQKK